MTKYIESSDVIRVIGVHKSTTITRSSLLEFIRLNEVEIDDVDYKEKIKRVINTKYVNTKYLKKDLKNIVNPPIKYGGFTIPEWEQLKKMPYVGVSLTTGEDIFLNGASIQCYASTILKLLPDPINMERTNTDIPHNIKIEVTWYGGDTEIRTTPFDAPKSEFKHYRILGCADE